ncbi:MAG: M20/M25/M40 family metallo-hydrolase [Gemmatimonadaceae bacterium]|nr:M20/M25/M40 family metallo-hydrolase [Gemmatimonadaceae bacterium]MCW5827189.1 M20/M25/M40 family metallo-hydrolase [Gemmatimonadaceae bacterium]
MTRILRCLALLGVLAPVVAAQAPDPVVRDTRAWHRANALPVLQGFRDFLSLPNVASDSAAIRRVADTLVAMFERRGVQMALLETPGSPPAVYGELLVPGASRTVMLYSHYDGQPVQPRDWLTAGPFTPELRDGHVERGGQVRTLEEAAQLGPRANNWRLYARSASDDRGPILMMLAALDALRAQGRQPSVNLKFFFEGEEEAGSQHLREMLLAHRARLAADLWLFLDGPRHQSGIPQIVHGVRGVMGLRVTTYGPARALHSGHYGNWAPNPANELTHLLAGMRATDGTITIDGFYDDVREITDADRRAIADAPSPDRGLAAELQLGRTETQMPLGLAVLRPALNITQLAGGTGTNAVMPSASAAIDFRLVPGQTPVRVRELVERHLQRQGYHLVHEVPDSATLRTHPRVVRLGWGQGYAAQQLPLDDPWSLEIHRVVQRAAGTTVARVPILGGSLPLSVFEEVLAARILTLPLVNYDNNQHAANEHLRLGEFWQGIEIVAAVMTGIGNVR